MDESQIISKLISAQEKVSPNPYCEGYVWKHPYCALSGITSLLKHRFYPRCKKIKKKLPKIYSGKWKRGLKGGNSFFLWYDHNFYV